MSRKNGRVALLWFLGSVCILIGSMTAGNVDKMFGVNPWGYLLAITLSFMFFLLGGLMWISVCVAMKRD